MKVAIVHDYLIQMGGAERVVAALHELFPQAPIYTSVFLKNKLSRELQTADIRASFMQNLPFMEKEFRMYFLFYPFAFSSFDLSKYDVIISSSSAYAKGIRKRKGQVHICYCYTPMRFAWRFNDYIERQELNPLLARGLSLFVPILKKWDLGTVKNVDYFIAISRFVSDRIKSIYGRDSVIIYPPVDTSLFKPSHTEKDYFLIVSRLVSYKRIDLAIKVFNKLGLTLKIAGEGPDLERLRSLAGDNIKFLGRLNDEEIKRLYSECRALIFSGEEDFGITPLEAAASGSPTIAYGRGGALETIIDGRTGILFDRQTEESLSMAVMKFKSSGFDKKDLLAQAEKFSKDRFKERIRGFLNENKIF
ncbi:MAG: glycosyltransferase [Candidatus Margulisiibacteriota bacterium]